MNWYRTASKDEEFEKMVEFFKKRTKRHIDLVKKYCKLAAEWDPERFGKLVERGEEHDASKYEDPEFEPYVYVTWKHKCKDDGKKFDPPEGIDEAMVEATEHHVKNNSHHPESHCARKTDLVNPDNRDKPPEDPVDAKEMGQLDLAEMVCDWCAMGEERGNTPREWADKNIGKRWIFTDKQKDLVYEVMDAVWKDGKK
jgi:hypothetical protein